jgi:ABC-type glycerol-3-phosphate transport system permease component
MAIAVKERPIRRALSWSWQERVFQVTITLVLLAIGILFLFPYWYMAVSSVREPFYNFDTLKIDVWPRVVSFAGYGRILEARVYGGEGELGAVGALLGGLGNTMFQEVTILLGGTLTSLLAAYAFAKNEFPGQGFFFYLLLSGMIIPGEVTLVPKYVMFTRWGFIGTHWALIVPAVMGAGGWFLMRMFMSTIPSAYIDAARIDGAGEFRIVWDVIAPLSKPVILTHGLFTFLGVWNDLMGPLMYVNAKGKYTLQMVLYRIQSSYNFVYGYAYGDTSGLRMQTLFAALVLGSLPTVILFIIFQRYITEGTIITGLKL